MKTSLILSLLVTTSAFADITLIQDTFMGEAKSPMKTTMYVKGDRVRTDSDTTTTMFMDTATGVMTTLMHEQKMVITTDMKQLAGLAKATPAAAPLPTTKITATGQKEKIDGYDCEIYLSENSGMVVKMWVTESYPNYAKLKEELKVMAKISSQGGPEQPQVPGLALKTEYEQQGYKFVTKLVSLSNTPVDESMFVIPEGYKAP